MLVYIGFCFVLQVMNAKPLIKEALQAEVGLPVDRNIPLIGFIGRLEEQKGSDILAAAIPQFIKENVQIIVLVRPILSQKNLPFFPFSLDLIKLRVRPGFGPRLENSVNYVGPG